MGKYREATNPRKSAMLAEMKVTKVPNLLTKDQKAF
jgi:hypothetical protein